jgi:hypothetical protein
MEDSARKTFAYSVKGLIDRVPFHCPMLQAGDDEAEADVTVTEGPVPTALLDRTAD